MSADVSMVTLRLLGDGHPGLPPLLLLDDALDLAHEGLHVDQEQGGCSEEGKKLYHCLKAHNCFSHKYPSKLQARWSPRNV